MTAVFTHGLTRSFGENKALDGLDLRIDAGQVVGLLGHNGAGKTTAVRILATLLTADAGTATVNGIDVIAQPARAREQIALAGQQATLDARLTGRENLILLGRLQRLSKRDAAARADALLTRFNLADAGDRLTGTYSGGMRRRLDLAASIVVHRPVVFLDEPTTGLDPISRAGMWESIRELVDEGAALLLTTQYLEEADRLADRITVLSGGRVVAEGTPRDLKDRVGARRVEATVDDVGTALVALRESGLTPEADERERRVSVPAPDGSRDLEQALAVLGDAGVVVEEAALRRPTLDDAFIALAGIHPEQPAQPELEPVS
jgi:ABC-2 type transport system ATP-binding protein